MMNIDEADRIIAELNICFPNKNLLVEEVIRWEENLSSYEYTDARAAIKVIENNCKYWPSWAEFREAIIPFTNERRRELSRAVTELPSAVISEEERQRSKEIIKELRNRWTKQ
jgi:hypothetical protein